MAMSKFRWSDRSLANLATCDTRLQQVADRALELGVVDIAFACGLRSMEEQNRLYAENKSKLLWPFGNHNVYKGKDGLEPDMATIQSIADIKYVDRRMVIDPDNYRRMLNIIEEDKDGHAKAMDLHVYFADGRRIPWEDTSTWMMFGGFILGIGHSLGIPLRWGGDWDGDWTNRDQSFNDFPHFELIDE